MASKDIENQHKAALEECSRLREENRRLRARLGIPEEPPAKQPEQAEISPGVKGSLNKVAYSCTDKHLGPREEVGTRAGAFPTA